MVRKEILLCLGLSGVFGCGPVVQPAGSIPRPETSQRQLRDTLTYYGETSDYSIIAREERINGFCRQRIVELKERTAGMFNSPYHVPHVIGWDYGCNFTLDYWFLNYQYKMNSILAHEILASFDIARNNTLAMRRREKNKRNQ